MKIEEKNPGTPKLSRDMNYCPFACCFIPFIFGFEFCVLLCFCSGFTTTISSTSTLPARIDYNCTTLPYKHYNNPSTTVFSKLRPSHFTLQSPLLRQSTHSTPTPPIVENIISDHYYQSHRRTLRRSDSYSPGILTQIEIVY